jgi:uncharacterized protein (TIGR01777 family)
VKVLLTGATGFVGSHLDPVLAAHGHVVRRVSRRPGADFDWSDSSLARGVRETDAVIHLAGEGIFDRRWSAKRKELLYSSRIETTRKLAKLCAERKPSAFLTASAIGWYGTSDTAEFDERSPHGNDFLANLCTDWEEATEAAVEAGVRVCRARIGVVLHPGGGAISKMLPFFRLGVGGPLGSGRQWVSWVHLDDLCSIFRFLLEDEKARGSFNATAPNPVTMRAFARALGRALHRPSALPVPKPVLRVALGEVAETLTTGQLVIPRRTLEAGFRFAHPEIDEALASLFDRRAETLERR